MRVTSHTCLVPGCWGEKKTRIAAEWAGWERGGSGDSYGAGGCSAPVPTRVLFSLQHSDGTFCVKPLKQKQVVSV